MHTVVLTLYVGSTCLFPSHLLVWFFLGGVLPSSFIMSNAEFSIIYGFLCMNLYKYLYYLKIALLLRRLNFMDSGLQDRAVRGNMILPHGTGKVLSELFQIMSI